MSSFLLQKTPPRIEMGGQAVIEGVLMRAKGGYAVALRREDGAIVIRQVPYRPLARALPLLKLPIVRGMTALIEMLAIGTRSLQWSAEVYEETLRRREGTPAESTQDPAQALQKEEAIDSAPLPRTASDAFRHAGFAGMLALSLALVVLMVIVAPNALTLLTGKLPFLHAWAEARGTLGFTEENHPFAFNLISGVFRAAILVGYVWVISLNRDIRRVFEYHGAEHKAVLELEAKGDERKVTVGGAQAHDTLHPRCGTTFLAVVVLVSIVFFAFAGAGLVAYVSGYPEWPFWQRKLATLGAHLLLLPLVAGTAFELMKFCARHERNPLCALLLWPGFRFQRLTTRPPDDEQVEVAVVAMLAALALDENASHPRQYVVRGLHDDETAPGYIPPSAPTIQPTTEAVG
ncbi:MAG: hypothetical protein PWP23_717 [Candidatus Sumerlaeota bacterium]|nr:hypothetical protein [Candidatus Sumerlaeota bacterium]